MTQLIMESDVMEKKRDILKGYNAASDSLVRKSCFLFGGPVNKNRKAKISVAGKFYQVLFDSKGNPIIVRE